MTTHTRKLLFSAALILFVTATGLAQGGQRGQRGRPPARPAPRGADGRPSFGPLPGELGVWLPGAGGAERLVDPEPGDPVDAQFPIPAAARFPGKLNIRDVPFQPWAKALHAYRRDNQLEPHTRCKPSGGPRQFLTPYGVEFVDLPELQRMFILDVGGPHTFRIIYMDGREHPKNLEPSYYGHNVGHWEGDTLIVDSVGYNEKFWFDRGTHPHTEQLHMIERFTRLDFNNIKYEVTIDDPGAYTKPWKVAWDISWQAGGEMIEYICQGNNQYLNHLKDDFGEPVLLRQQ